MQIPSLIFALNFGRIRRRFLGWCGLLPAKREKRKAECPADIVLVARRGIPGKICLKEIWSLL